MKKFYKVKVVAVLFVICFINQLAYTQSLDRKWLISKFNEFDNAINNGQGYSNATNEDGTLAWTQSYLLEAYLDMYEATGNIKYIQKFVSQEDEVLSNNDKERGIQDYKGRVRTGWSATKYSKNKERMIHIAHSGMILYPIVKFIVMVKSQKKLKKYINIANKYIILAEKSVSEFEGQWRFNPETKEGSYWFEGDEPLNTDLKAPMPFNGPLAMGRVLIMLYLATNKGVYIDKAKALAWHFKNNLVETKEGYYIWGYRPNLKKYPQVEDISHGAIDVDFAILAYKNGIVFNKSDIEKFEKSLLNANKKAKNYAFSKFVDGNDDLKNKEYSNAPGDISKVAVGRWLELSAYNCDIYKVVFDYLAQTIKESKKEHPAVMLGIAKLVKYYEVCYANK